MTRFDNPDLPPNRFAEFLGDVASVLMQPSEAILGLIHVRGMSSAAEWATMAANSSLLVFGLAYVIIDLTLLWRRRWRPSLDSLPAS